MTRTRLLAALLVAASLVAACGGDDEPETVTVTETQTAPATEPETTRTEPETTTTEPETEPAEPASVDCGDLAQSGAGVYNVRATGVDCETAIVIARQWQDECATRPDGSCRVTLGFSCRYRQKGYESGAIRCAGSRGAVTFEAGA